ncbi:MAG TPA: YgeY family selenium metabolism-linked hydrolase [Chloroflexota bacterium]|nr:YgeY family selenium metabolism-linked hydrolase [Chloroflexota bacterium]
MAERETLARINDYVDQRRDDIIAFLQEIVRIPSTESQIGAVGEAIGNRMRSLGFDEVRTDSMGNILGRAGSGTCSLLFDSHIDTVGVGDPAEWHVDPYAAEIENGIMYGRGTCDEKGSTPPMIYAIAALKELGLLDGWTLYYFGNMEEWCDGIAPHALVEHEGIRPDFVVIGEPTRLEIYRGHRGRVEMSATFKGKSAHAAMPRFGENPVYKSVPFIAGVEALNDRLPDHPFLGPGTIAVTNVDVNTPSLNAVPAEAEVYLDRRVTLGETAEGVLAEVRSLPGAENAAVEIPRYEEPSYTGFVFSVDKVFPAWALSEDHPLLRAAEEDFRAAYGREPSIGKWEFSTNGTYWMGKANIPSIGFGPGDERYAHSVNEQIPVDEVVEATRFYAALPLFLSRSL